MKAIVEATDLGTKVADLVGDTESIGESLYLLHRLTSRSYFEAPPPKSNLLYPRILWLLAMNPSISRYRISKELGSPHSTTLEVVSELCRHGLLRIGGSKKARTGLPSPTYRITSIGLAPILDLCFARVVGDLDWEFHNPSEQDMAQRELQSEFRANFSALVERTNHLPAVGFFLKKWGLFKEVQVEAGLTLSILFGNCFRSILWHPVGPRRIVPGVGPIVLTNGTYLGTPTHQPTIGEILLKKNRSSVSPSVLQRAMNYVERQFKLSFMRRVMKSSLFDIRHHRKDTPAVKLLAVLCQDPEFKKLVQISLKKYRSGLQRRQSSLKWIQNIVVRTVNAKDNQARRSIQNVTKF